MNEKDKPEGKQRARKLLLASVVGVLFLACVVVFVHGIRRVDPKDLQATIARGLPLGSNQQTVSRFLDDQHMPHSGYVPQFRRIYAGIGRSSVVGMAPCRIHIYFDFDADGKLVSYKVHEICDFL
jgi:hypothetical protein